MNKLKDVAGLLKAKITKDELEEALINATSQQNWQASTHILHEIANAAYNYQKWQQINQFIWDKLKKGKSWRKILKTLSLVEFLLKNGPPSIISSFKYDIYQFRSFDNFSHYDEGIDRGEAIRERAKVVVDLLSNEELLQEERVKAKTIRERMSGVVSGSNYGGFSGKQGIGSISGSKYGSIDNKSYQSGGFSGNNYNDGGLGVYGDYGTTKSTLDKYKDKTASTAMTKKPTVSTITQPLNEDPKEKEKQMVIENKKPFESVAKKLVKPGSKPVPKQQTQATGNQKPQSNKNIMDDDDIFGSDSVPQVQYPAVQQPVVQQPVQQTFVQQPVQQNTNAFELGFNFETPVSKPQPVQQPIQQQIQAPVQQPVQPVQPQLPVQNLYQQPTNVPNNFNSLNMNAFTQPQFPQQQPLYGQQGQFGGYGQQQPNNQFGMIGGYQQPIQQGYGQPYQQPMMQGQMGMGMNLNMGYGQQYQQSQNNLPQQQAWSQGISLSAPIQTKPQGGFAGISLQTTTTTKKDEDEFGNFASGQNANVKWLTNEQKGLIDFSDFGDELKNGGNKNQQKSNNANSGNNIDTTWSW